MRMHLRDYTRAIDVPHYTCAISPGKHCPLFGVGIVFQGMAGVTLIYVGPQDCVYYAQTDTLLRQLAYVKSGGPQVRTLAVQLSDSDLIFGIRPQLEKLLEKEAQREDTNAVFLVTSCSVEVLSEDLRGTVDAVAARTGKKIALIPIENFKTFSYFEGTEKALAALTTGLKPMPRQEKSFAVLGARKRGADESEPVRWLMERGYTLQSILPYETNSEKVNHLPEVAFTLVLEGCGLEVAKQLERDYGIPYVRFDRRLDLQHAVQAWRELSVLVGEDREQWIEEQLCEVRQMEEVVSAKVSGTTFFYNQTTIYPFEACLFLSRLGMEPLCIFQGSVRDKEADARLALAERANPVLWQNANQSALRAMLEEQLPDYFVGATGGIIREYPVLAFSFPTGRVGAGFEYYKTCLRRILAAKKMEGKR